MFKYKLPSVILLLYLLLVVAGCSASDEDIIGKWKEVSVNDYNEQAVVAEFFANHKGEMAVYSKRAGFSHENFAVFYFDWSIDGYVVELSGTCTYESGENKTHTTRFRFKDDKLVCEGFLPVASFNLGSNHSHCVLEKL